MEWFVRSPLLLTVIDVIQELVDVMRIVHDEGTSKAITVLGPDMRVVPVSSRLDRNSLKRGTAV